MPESATTCIVQKCHQGTNLCLEDLKQLNRSDAIGVRCHKTFVTEISDILVKMAMKNSIKSAFAILFLFNC